MSHEIVRTRAGTLAMRCLDAQEVMHPGVGPLVEAQCLYVEQSQLARRLRNVNAATLVVFDVGMGAASNALAARATSERAPSGAARLELVSFERDLGALKLAMTAGDAFGLCGEAAEAAQAIVIHGNHETPRTRWTLIHGDLLNALRSDKVAQNPADIVFWDPFSPRSNPQLWTIAAFSALRAVAKPGCTLFTYSASTAVRLAMLLAGWAVGVGDSIGDKAATTVAATSADDLARPLDRSWLARLSRSDVPLPTDAPADVVARASAAPQFSHASESRRSHA